ncbi:hypothetical protein O4328_39320 [Rhodococcus opacus]|uniref:Uncharacterized protein n=1 Tax=Rhodococcus opacus TaxID=37919 RepID=A0AAX3YT27_RHOOP|nr:hypothetical protein [Rhodococcus opacus]MCZ4589622.1 hypothetical protein [Rhodococcus opacus]WLF51219.1 hypothetical protein Q5707_38300 [Rhodococcus opacus]
MITVSADPASVAGLAAHLLADEDLIDRLLPKDPWFHHGSAYLDSAYRILSEYLTGEWQCTPPTAPSLDLHGALAGTSLEVSVDLVGPEPNAQSLSGVVYLDLPNLDTIRLALANVTRDTELFSAQHLYDPAAQINHVIATLCELVNRALAPVSALLDTAA